MTKAATKNEADRFAANKKKRQQPWQKDPSFINAIPQIQKNLSTIISSEEYCGQQQDNDTKGTNMDFGDEKVVLTNKILNHISKSHKSLNSVLKKSKVFITRKLIRKLKDARENLDSGSADEDKEGAERLIKHFSDRMEIIKLIKKSELATTHLRQKISKNRILRSHALVKRLYLEILPETVGQTSEETFTNGLPESMTPEDGYKILKELEDQLVNQKNARSEFGRCVDVLVKLIQGRDDGVEEEKNFHEKPKSLPKYKLRDNEKSDYPHVKSQISPAANKNKIIKSGKKEPNSKAITRSSLFVTSLADVPSSSETDNDDTLSDNNNNIDDDWSDPDFDKYYGGGAGGGKQRKNRMGQRERRLLWKKKYGEKANHLVALKETPAIDKKRYQQRKDITANNNLQEHQKHDVDSERKLHPSWEAKKLQSEKMSNIKFKGKKIIFDINEDSSSKSDNVTGKHNIDSLDKSHTHWKTSKRQKQL